MYNLKDLREAAGLVLLELRRSKTSFNEPINGGNLRAVSAEFFITDTWEAGHRVYIEKASANCPTLRLAVAELLATKGWGGVEVVTEW